MTLSVAMIYYCAECHYGEGRILFTAMLNVIMMSVVVLNVDMLSVVAPLCWVSFILDHYAECHDAEVVGGATILRTMTLRITQLHV